MSKSDFHILIVEDNQSMRAGIQATLQKADYAVHSAQNGAEALSLLEKTPCHLVITDLKMPQMDGLALFDKIKQYYSDLAVIFITAYATVDIAVETLKKGADDFITKPFPLDELREKVAIVYYRYQKLAKTKEKVSEKPVLIGKSAGIKKVRALITKVAKVDSPVLITGESGTGKELVAQRIHLTGPRKNGPFIAVNCSALNENLLESELFGHEKGAFTGAVKAHAGKFEQAAGGSLFLDEIGDMSAALQVKLLRVLQTKKFQQVGGEQDISSDFRLITATNRDLKQAIREKEFRSDLYYRLNVVPIHIPPLRERREDIPLLIEHLLKSKARKLEREIPQVDETLLQHLRSYSWPGNIRELENFLERALIFVEDNNFSTESFSLSDLEIEPQAQGTTAPGNKDLVSTLETMEREMIVKALRQARGVKQKAARKLKLKPSTLYYKIDKFNISESEYLS